MKIVVIGGTGLIGSKLVEKLRRAGHEPLAASPETGVDSYTGKGLEQALEGAQVVVDVSNAPAWDDAAVLDFFQTTAYHILDAETFTGVKHHVLLSVVGVDRLRDSGYMRGKLAQEEAVKAHAVPYTILRATQFFEFVGRIADSSMDGDSVHLAPMLIQPEAADDVAAALAGVALGEPVNGVVELAGPEQFRLDELARRVIRAKHDPRQRRSEPFASPLRASDEQLHGLPPAFVIVDEADPLRDEGEAYAARLRAAGVPVTTVRYDGITHDFMMLNPLSDTHATRAAVPQASSILRDALWRIRP
jgi:uncharacterized protein YbjT (DUF2867 family)